MAEATAPDRLLRFSDVIERTGLARNTIYDYVSRDEFPKPVKLGQRMVAWRESDVNRWMESLPTAALS